jgi:tellurite resistance protein TerC
MWGLLVGTLKQARRLIVIVVGFSVLLIGLAMVILPGPAMIVIPLGLAILAMEFVWARRLLLRMKTEAGRLTSKLRGGAGGTLGLK